MTVNIDGLMDDVQTQWLKDQISQLQTEKPPHWQETAVKLIKQNRLQDNECEIKRIQNLGLVDDISLIKINNALSKKAGKLPNLSELLYFLDLSLEEVSNLDKNSFIFYCFIAGFSSFEFQKFPKTHCLQLAKENTKCLQLNDESISDSDEKKIFSITSVLKEYCLTELKERMLDAFQRLPLDVIKRELTYAITVFDLKLPFPIDQIETVDSDEVISSVLFSLDQSSILLAMISEASTVLGDVYDQCLLTIESQPQKFNNEVVFEKKSKDFVLMAQALEIKKIYQNTHHVFLHAQNSGLLVVPDLIKEFIRAITPENCAHGFKYLRTPGITRDYDISQYSKASSVNDCQGVGREDLLSVDGCFFHNQSYESSIFFMQRNSNILHSSKFLLDQIISTFCPSLSASEISEFSYQVQDLTNTHSCDFGNLYTICIPKESSSNMQYKAHAFGVPCSCETEDSSIEILDAFQNEEIKENFHCSLDHQGIPQYRLFMPEIKPENDVKIHLIPSNKEYRDYIKTNVRALVQKILLSEENAKNQSHLNLQAI